MAISQTDSLRDTDAHGSKPLDTGQEGSEAAPPVMGPSGATHALTAQGTDRTHGSVFPFPATQTEGSESGGETWGWGVKSLEAYPGNRMVKCTYFFTGFNSFFSD